MFSWDSWYTYLFGDMGEAFAEKERMVKWSIGIISILALASIIAICIAFSDIHYPAKSIHQIRGMLQNQDQLVYIPVSSLIQMKDDQYYIPVKFY